MSQPPWTFLPSTSAGPPGARGEPGSRDCIFGPKVSDYSLHGGQAMSERSRSLWTFGVTSAALFMASLDNLVVTTALPSIRAHLHASLAGLQWTVNAYTLTFAVLLLTGATLGERYGRRRLFTLGLGLFTAGCCAAPVPPRPRSVRAVP